MRVSPAPALQREEGCSQVPRQPRPWSGCSLRKATEKTWMKHNKSIGNGGKVFVDSAHGHSVKMEFREKEMEPLPDALEC